MCSEKSLSLKSGLKTRRNEFQFRFEFGKKKSSDFDAKNLASEFSSSLRMRQSNESEVFDRESESQNEKEMKLKFPNFLGISTPGN